MENDANSIGAVTKIELLHENFAPIEAEDLSVRFFDGLLSGVRYGVRVTYEYDLNDGRGIQQILNVAYDGESSRF